MTLKSPLRLLAAHPLLTVFVVTAVLMSLLLALAPASLKPNPGYNDYEIFYRPVAENLLDGRGYTGRPGVSDLHNPPGYIFILVGLYAIALLPSLSQGLLVAAFAVVTMAGSAVLVFLLARRLFGTVVAWIAAALWATYPINLIMASYRFSEIPYAFVLLLTLYLLVRTLEAERRLPLWCLAVGLLVGAAALIRPAAIALFAPLALAVLLARRAGPVRARAWLAVALVAGYVVAVTPWEVWAYGKEGRVIPLSDAGHDTMVDGVTVGARPRDESGRGFLVPDDVHALSQRIQAERESLKSTGDVVDRLAEEPPGTLVQLVLSKAARAWYGTNALKLEPLIALVQLVYLTLAGIGLAWALRAGGWLRWNAVLVLLVVGYSWAVTMAALSIVRYMAPVLGLLLVFAALPVTAVALRLLGRSEPLLAGRDRERL